MSSIFYNLILCLIVIYHVDITVGSFFGSKPAWQYNFLINGEQGDEKHSLEKLIRLIFGTINFGFIISVFYGHIIGTKNAIRASIIVPLVYNVFTFVFTFTCYVNWNLISVENRKLLSINYAVLCLLLIYIFIKAEDRSSNNNYNSNSNSNIYGNINKSK